MVERPSEISDADFERLREFIAKRFGIALAPDKRALVEARLARFIQDRGYEGFEAYCDALLRTEKMEALGSLFDRISTNHTHFYREPAHFDFLMNNVLEERIGVHRARRSNDLRVWCAACSTGEEAYVLAMLLRDFLGEEALRWRAGVLATDLSGRALATAREGIYTPENVSHLPVRLRQRYFDPTPDGRKRVIASLRSDVVFRRLNLMNPEFPFRGRFDVIFCRNVMIYFTPSTQCDLVRRLYDVTQPGGYLFVGHSEALDRATSPYEFVKPGVHRRAEVPTH